MKTFHTLCIIALISSAGFAQEQQRTGASSRPQAGYSASKEESIKAKVAGEELKNVFLIPIEGKNFRLVMDVPKEYMDKYKFSISVGDEITVTGCKWEFTNGQGRDVSNFVAREITKGEAVLPLLDKEGILLYTPQFRR